MSAIGGYFGLEVGEKNQDYPFLHSPGVNSGRHAFEVILRNLDPKPAKVYIPYYTCEVILEPLQRLSIDYEFYHIDRNLEIEKNIHLRDNEYIVVNNYFGIKDEYIRRISLQYKNKLIVDCAQAFFAPALGEIKMFFSPRKFIGVADGGYTRPAYDIDTDTVQDFSTDRSIHLLRRIDSGSESGYTEFQRDDASLSLEPIKKMSELTRSVLESSDCKRIIERRRENFEKLHHALVSQNKLNIPNRNHFNCPMVYPYWTDDENLRNKLIANKVFVATYWLNVFEWCDKESTEYELANNLITLPIDQRYGKEDMRRILSIILK